MGSEGRVCEALAAPYPPTHLPTALQGLLLVQCCAVTFFARSPKRRVERVSCMLYDEGDALMISAVRELPPRDSCSTRVSLESR